MLQSAVRDFADAELVPNAGAWDKNGEMDDSMRQAIRGIGDMGLMGVAIDPESGDVRVGVRERPERAPGARGPAAQETAGEGPSSVLSAPATKASEGGRTADATGTPRSKPEKASKQHPGRRCATYSSAPLFFQRGWAASTGLRA